MSSDCREHQGGVDADGDLDSTSLLSIVLDATTDGILLADRSGTIVHANTPLLKLFGYEAGDLVGEPIEILMPEDQRREHRHKVERYVDAPRHRPMGRDDLDIEGQHADGSKIPVDIQLSALPGSSLIVATVRDMTAQRDIAARCALDRLDLARVRAEADQLRASLDLVIQRLFGLGMSMAAGASDEALLTERMAKALQKIDEIIEAVQSSRGSIGPVAARTSGP